MSLPGASISKGVVVAAKLNPSGNVMPGVPDVSVGNEIPVGNVNPVNILY